MWPARPKVCCAKTSHWNELAQPSPALLASLQPDLVFSLDVPLVPFLRTSVQTLNCIQHPKIQFATNSCQSV